MVTTIGLNPDYNMVLNDLITMDYDAAAAYQEAMDRLQGQQIKRILGEFREDHLRHIRELSMLAHLMRIEPPTGPDIMAALTKGKVIIADLFGDKAILMAMKSNEEDTNTAYERAFAHEGIPVQALDIIERAYHDEQRHKKWLVDTIENMSVRAA